MSFHFVWDPEKFFPLCLGTKNFCPFCLGPPKISFQIVYDSVMGGGLGKGPEFGPDRYYSGGLDNGAC